LIPMVNVIVNAADARKATSISAFRISSVTEITTFMVIVEGNSRPQNQAIALAVEEVLKCDHAYVYTYVCICIYIYVCTGIYI
jgi:ribosomal silencing factor RsfS